MKNLANNVFEEDNFEKEAVNEVVNGDSNEAAEESGFDFSENVAEADAAEAEEASTAEEETAEADTADTEETKEENTLESVKIRFLLWRPEIWELTVMTFMRMRTDSSRN